MLRTLRLGSRSQTGDDESPPHHGAVVPIGEAQDPHRSPDARRGRVRPAAGRLAGRAGPFLAGIAVALLAIVLSGVVNPPPPRVTIQDVQQAVASALASQTPEPPHGEVVYAAVQPSLVLIQTEVAPGASGRPASLSPSAAPAGSPAPGGAPDHGLGAGVVVNDAGQVLTALHVVSGASAITLTFPDGSTSPA